MGRDAMAVVANRGRTNVIAAINGMENTSLWSGQAALGSVPTMFPALVKRSYCCIRWKWVSNQPLGALFAPDIVVGPLLPFPPLNEPLRRFSIGLGIRWKSDCHRSDVSEMRS